LVHDLRIEKEELGERRAEGQKPEGKTSPKRPKLVRQKEEILTLLDEERRGREEDVRSMQSDYEIYAQGSDDRDAASQASLNSLREETRYALQQREEISANLTATADRLESCQEALAASRAEARLNEAQLARVEAERDTAVAAASLQSRLELTVEEEKRESLETQLSLVKQQTVQNRHSQEEAISSLHSQAQRNDAEVSTLRSELEDRVDMEKMLGLRLANADVQRESAVRKVEGLEGEVERLRGELMEVRRRVMKGETCLAERDATAGEQLERLEQRVLESDRLAFGYKEKNLELEARLLRQGTVLESLQEESQLESETHRGVMQQQLERLAGAMSEKDRSLAREERTTRELQVRLDKQEGECAVLYESIRQGGEQHQAALASQIEKHLRCLKEKDKLVAATESQLADAHARVRRQDAEISSLQQRYEIEMKKHQIFVDGSHQKQEEAQRLSRSLISKEQALQGELTEHHALLASKTEAIVELEATLKQQRSQLEVLSQVISREHRDQHHALESEIASLRESILDKERRCFEQEQQYVELEATLRRQEADEARRSQLSGCEEASNRAELARVKKEFASQKQELHALHVRFESAASTLTDANERLREAEMGLGLKTASLLEQEGVMDFQQAKLQGQQAELEHTTRALAAETRRLTKLHALVELRAHARDTEDESRRESQETGALEALRRRMELESALKKSLAREEELTAELATVEESQRVLRDANCQLEGTKGDQRAHTQKLESRWAEQLLQVRLESQAEIETRKATADKAINELAACKQSHQDEHEQYLRELAIWQKKLETTRRALDVELRKNSSRPSRWEAPRDLVGFPGHLLAFYLVHDYEAAVRCHETIRKFLELDDEEERGNYLLRFNTLLRLKYETDLLAITDDEARAGDFLWAHFPWDEQAAAASMVDTDGNLNADWRCPTTTHDAAEQQAAEQARTREKSLEEANTVLTKRLQEASAREEELKSELELAEEAERVMREALLPRDNSTKDRLELRAMEGMVMEARAESELARDLLLAQESSETALLGEVAEEAGMHEAVLKSCQEELESETLKRAETTAKLTELEIEMEKIKKELLEEISIHQGQSREGGLDSSYRHVIDLEEELKLAGIKIASLEEAVAAGSAREEELSGELAAMEQVEGLLKAENLALEQNRDSEHNEHLTELALMEQMIAETKASYMLQMENMHDKLERLRGGCSEGGGIALPQGSVALDVDAAAQAVARDETACHVLLPASTLGHVIVPCHHVLLRGALAVVEASLHEVVNETERKLRESDVKVVRLEGALQQAQDAAEQEDPDPIALLVHRNRIELLEKEKEHLEVKSSRIELLETERAKLEIQLDENKTAFRERLVSALKEVEEKMEAMRSLHQKELQLAESRENGLREEVEMARAELTAAEKGHDTSLRVRVAEALKEVDQKMEAQRDQHTAEIKEANQKMEAQRHQHAFEFKTFEERMEAQRQQQAIELQKVDRQHATGLKEASQKTEMELQRQQHATEMKKVDQEMVIELMRQQHATEMKMLDEKSEARRKQHANEVQMLKEKAVVQEAEIKAQKASVAKAISELELCEKLQQDEHEAHRRELVRCKKEADENMDAQRQQLKNLEEEATAKETALKMTLADSLAREEELRSEAELGEETEQILREAVTAPSSMVSQEELHAAEERLVAEAAALTQTRMHVSALEASLHETTAVLDAQRADNRTQQKLVNETDRQLQDCCAKVFGLEVALKQAQKQQEREDEEEGSDPVALLVQQNRLQIAEQKAAAREVELKQAHYQAAADEAELQRAEEKASAREAELREAKDALRRAEEKAVQREAELKQVETSLRHAEEQADAKGNEARNEARNAKASHSELEARLHTLREELTVSKRQENARRTRAESVSKGDDAKLEQALGRERDLRGELAAIKAKSQQWQLERIKLLQEVSAGEVAQKKAEELGAEKAQLLRVVEEREASQAGGSGGTGRGKNKMMDKKRHEEEIARLKADADMMADEHRRHLEAARKAQEREIARLTSTLQRDHEREIKLLKKKLAGESRGASASNSVASTPRGMGRTPDPERRSPAVVLDFSDCDF